MQLRMTTEGEGVEPFSSLNLSGTCGTGTTRFGPLLEEAGPDGTSILTGTFPRAEVEKVANAKLVAEPDTLVGYNARDASPRVWIIDDTDVGTNFTFVEPTQVGREKPKPKKRPKLPPPKKKKKKNKPKPKPKVCAAYAPGENGADAPIAVVTDDATAEKPVEVTIAAGAGFGTGTGSPADEVTMSQITHVYHNVQVDSKAKEAGLYVRLEMPHPSDYDLYLQDDKGEVKAHAAGFNPEPAVFDDTEGGGHTETEAEVLEGIKTADCGGYTADVATATGEGGDLTLKLWLGEVKFDPNATPDEAVSRAARETARAAASMF
jgi:hypothetical protein